MCQIAGLSSWASQTQAEVSGILRVHPKARDLSPHMFFLTEIPVWKGQGGVLLAKASAVQWFPWVPGPKEGCSIAVITEVQGTPLSPIPVSTKPPCLLVFQMQRLKKF